MYSNPFSWKTVWHCLSLRQRKVSHSLQTAEWSLLGEAVRVHQAAALLLAAVFVVATAEAATQPFSACLLEPFLEQSNFSIIKGGSIQNQSAFVDLCKLLDYNTVCSISDGSYSYLVLLSPPGLKWTGFGRLDSPFKGSVQ